MGKKSKDTIIKELQRYISSNDMYLESLNKRLNELTQIIDDGYRNSITHYQQKQEIEFLTKLHHLDQSLYDAQKRQILRVKDRLYSAPQQLKQQGITENKNCDYQLEDLYDQINYYKGKFENREETIKTLNKEIAAYQQKVAELQLSLASQGSNDINELKDQLLERNGQIEQYRIQMQDFLMVHTALLQQLLIFHEDSTITRDQLDDAVRNILKKSPAQHSSDILQPLQDSAETQRLKDQISALEKELSDLAAEKKQYGRPPKISPEDTAQIAALVQAGWSYRKIAKTYGYSLGTISRTYQYYKDKKTETM